MRPLPLPRSRSMHSPSHPLSTTARWARAGLLAVTLCFAAVAWADDAKAVTSDGADPVLAGVVDMLQADLPQDVIMQWVNAAPAPRLPSAQEMIELRRAGAGDPLLGLILQRAGQGTADSSAGRAPQAPRPRATPTRPAAPSPKLSAVDELVRTAFKVSYDPYVPEDVEEWDFFLYLDGKPLSYVPRAGLLGTKALEFVHLTSPGPHRLRLTRERHQKTRRGVEHEARVSDVVIDLDLKPGLPAEVEVRFDQTVLRSKNPLSYSVSQGAEHRAEAKLGGDPEAWPEICEDVERTPAAGKRDASRQRRLEGCVRWASLWTPAGTTERHDVLDALSRFEYRPIPRHQSIH